MCVDPILLQVVVNDDNVHVITLHLAFAFQSWVSIDTRSYSVVV